MWHEFDYLYQILTWRGIGIMVLGWLILGRILCRLWRGCLLFYRKKVWQRMAVFHRTASGLWPRQEDEEVDFSGFFATILWIGVVIINLFLLAQILELVAVGGRRISMGVFGSYNMLGLMTAAIWILAQVFLGHISYMARSGAKGESIEISSLLPWWGWYATLVVAVIVEFILGIVRAWLLSIGEVVEAPTMIDAVIMRGGPFIAGIVSFIVPVVEVGSGVLAIESYVGINWGVCTRRFKAIAIWILCAFLWWVFPAPPRTESGDVASNGGEKHD